MIGCGIVPSEGGLNSLFLPTSGLEYAFRPPRGLFRDIAQTLPATADGDKVQSAADSHGNTVERPDADFAPVLRAEADGAYGVEFPGAGSDVLLVSESPTGLNSETGTVIATAKLNAAGLGTHRLFVCRSDRTDVNRDVWFGILNGDKMWSVQRNNDTLDNIQSVSTFTDTTGYHVYMFRSDGSSYDFVADGVAEAHTVFAGSDNGDWFADTPTLNNFVVGARRNDFFENLEMYGRLGYIFVYNRKISSAEANRAVRICSRRYRFSVGTL